MLAKRNADWITNMSQSKATVLLAGSVCRWLLSELHTGEERATEVQSSGEQTSRWAKGNEDSQRFQWMQLGLDGSFSLSPNLPELCQPSWLVGLPGLSVPSQSPREVAKPQQIWRSLPRKKLVGLRGSVPAYPLLYYQRNARQVNRTEITSQREKNISLEVDTILFTNSFCSAMKEIDPALSLIHKLPLMKLLELLKGGTDESGLVTVLPHWP